MPRVETYVVQIDRLRQFIEQKTSDSARQALNYLTHAGYRPGTLAHVRLSGKDEKIAVPMVLLHITRSQDPNSETTKKIKLTRANRSSDTSKPSYNGILFISDGEEIAAIMTSSHNELKLVLAFADTGSRWGVRIGRCLLGVGLGHIGVWHMSGDKSSMHVYQLGAGTTSMEPLVPIPDKFGVGTCVSVGGLYSMKVVQWPLHMTIHSHNVHFVRNACLGLLCSRLVSRKRTGRKGCVCFTKQGALEAVTMEATMTNGGEIQTLSGLDFVSLVFEPDDFIANFKPELLVTEFYSYFESVFWPTHMERLSRAAKDIGLLLFAKASYNSETEDVTEAASSRVLSVVLKPSPEIDHLLANRLRVATIRENVKARFSRDATSLAALNAAWDNMPHLTAGVTRQDHDQAAEEFRQNDEEANAEDCAGTAETIEVLLSTTTEMRSRASPY